MTEHRRSRRHEPAQATAGSWRHRMLPTARPAWCQRPVEERELVAHEPCLLDEWTLVEAAGDLHCSIGTGAVHRADHRGGCAARGHQRWVPPHPCHRGSAPVRRPRRAARGPGRRAAHGSGHGVGPARGTRHPAGSLRRQQHRPRTRSCTAATTATTAPFLCQRAGADTTCERQESTMTAKPRPTVGARRAAGHRDGARASCSSGAAWASPSATSPRPPTTGPPGSRPGGQHHHDPTGEPVRLMPRDPGATSRARARVGTPQLGHRSLAVPGAGPPDGGRRTLQSRRTVRRRGRSQPARPTRA